MPMAAAQAVLGCAGIPVKPGDDVSQMCYRLDFGLDNSHCCHLLHSGKLHLTHVTSYNSGIQAVLGCFDGGWMPNQPWIQNPPILITVTTICHRWHRCHFSACRHQPRPCWAGPDRWTEAAVRTGSHTKTHKNNQQAINRFIENKIFNHLNNCWTEGVEF